MTDTEALDAIASILNHDADAEEREYKIRLIVDLTGRKVTKW